MTGYIVEPPARQLGESRTSVETASERGATFRLRRSRDMPISRRDGFGASPARRAANPAVRLCAKAQPRRRVSCRRTDSDAPAARD